MTGNRTACKGGRWRTAWVAVALGATALLPAAAPASAPDDEPVVLAIVNEMPEPLRCTVLFAHFVSKEIGTIAASAEISLSMFRQKTDGALWIPRTDGRRMMIETVECGAAALWAETRGQFPLLPVRAGREVRYHSSCRRSGGAICTDPAPTR